MQFPQPKRLLSTSIQFIFLIHSLGDAAARARAQRRRVPQTRVWKPLQMDPHLEGRDGPVDPPGRRLCLF